MMGVGTTWGAITFVNALSTGIGSAAAIKMPVRAELSARRLGTGSVALAMDPASDSPLTRSALAATKALWFADQPTELRLSIRSSIPPARGLKSSSAVAAAIVLAGADASGAEVDAESVARTTAEITRHSGLSATGAFDDALACIEGGAVVTDNRTQAVLRRGTLPPEWRVVLWIPPARHAPSPTWASRFESERSFGRPAVEAAEQGRWLDALTANSELVERVMGYEYGPLRQEILRRGALGAGVSGMGPTLAAIARADSVAEVSAAFPSDGSQVVVTGFCPPHASRGGR
jgi:shikimate kinase